jgi:hypothetical protein
MMKIYTHEKFAWGEICGITILQPKAATPSKAAESTPTPPATQPAAAPTVSAEATPAATATTEGQGDSGPTAT